MTTLLLLAAASLTPAAQAQVRTVQGTTARYADFEVAKREGWTKFGGDSPLMGEHWSLPPEKGGIDYVSGQPLDFRRPSNLMYTLINGRRVLTGVSFNVRLGPGQVSPEGFAGSADRWHVHDFRAALAAATKERPIIGWLARGWIDKNWGAQSRLAMAHVWTGPIPNPDGIFADHNRAVPYAKLGLPLSFADGASETAARGLNLATPGGCAESIDGALWIANAGRAKGRLHAACKAAVDHLRPVLGSRDQKAINQMAEHAWMIFDAAWQRELTPEQRVRIATMTEHGHSEASATPGEHHHDH